jgi:hypothetical protein
MSAKAELPASLSDVQQRTDSGQISTLRITHNGHPRGACGGDLARRYYQRELRPVSFPRK